MDIAVLGLLEHEDLHGYELKRRLVDTLAMASGASYGSLYPSLARLERLGALRSVEPATATGSPIPQTGSLGGELAAYRARSAERHRKNRKVYRITPEGVKLFRELLAVEPEVDDPRGFALRLAFARHLEADARMEMLERRRLRLVDRLTRARAAVAAVDRSDRYLQSLLDHDLDGTMRDLSWVEGLIAQERGAAPGTAHPVTPTAPCAPAPSIEAFAGGLRHLQGRAGSPAPSIHSASARAVGVVPKAGTGDPREPAASVAGENKETR